MKDKSYIGNKISVLEDNFFKVAPTVAIAVLVWPKEVGFVVRQTNIFFYNR